MHNLPSTRFSAVLLAIACCIALAFSLLPQAEAAMRANVATAKVTPFQRVVGHRQQNAAHPRVHSKYHLLFPGLLAKNIRG